MVNIAGVGIAEVEIFNQFDHQARAQKAVLNQTALDLQRLGCVELHLADKFIEARFVSGAR
jgi:hypothetical protein